ncbi:MAG: helix-turn-helix domain-containing protein [Firmicutes bacterium]|nr:helix-turn-helix domain-containing protein [Bacillota bacterium]
MNIGDRIRDCRKLKKMTQADLAAIINKTPQVVSNWERGYTPVIPHEDVLALAVALETTPNHLLGRPDNKIEGPLIIREERSPYAVKQVQCGDRIEMLRESRGLTQEQFAKLLEIDVSELAELEKSKESTELAMLEKIAGFFGIKVDYFLAETITVEQSAKDDYSEYATIWKNRGYEPREINEILTKWEGLKELLGKKKSDKVEK